MDDSSQTIKNFEHALKNVYKTPLALYSDNKNKNTRSFLTKNQCSARDVISNLNLQIKAIQKADTAVSCKQDKKKLDKYKKSSFLPVNMLPKEKEVTNQKPVNRFETQCVSDTQLIDIIDNAEEIANANDGITQEFDSTFCELEDADENSSSKNTTSNKNVAAVENKSNINDNSVLSSMSKCEVKESTIDVNVTNREKIDNTNAQNSRTENLAKSIEEVMQNDNTQISESCMEILEQVDEEIDKRRKDIKNVIIDEVISPSPVFQIVKSKSPSPLVFDLGRFESFEKLALPIIEENTDLTTAKQLINSQIIGTELFIQTDLRCDSRSTDESTSPVLNINTETLRIKKTPLSTTDQSTYSTKNNRSQNDLENNDNFLQDEILFSSDEEFEYVHKELQDIPLTCALETSFYEQPDVLDKTMYVGFQTASNRSIQINRDSFTKAKSVLDEIEQDIASSSSLADLVDSLCSKKDTDNRKEQCCMPTKTFEDTDIRLDCKDKHNNDPDNIGTRLNDKNHKINDDPYNVETNPVPEAKIVINEDETSPKKVVEALTKPAKRKFDGFMTASNKKIKLSDIALARCKKVFQNIDLEEDFNDNCQELDSAESTVNSIETKLKNKEHSAEPEYISPIDEDILQEFSRDMSLIEEETSKAVQFIGFKTASEKEIKISDAAMAKTKNLFEDIDNEDKVLNIPEKPQQFCGFQTASHKNIKISNNALMKSNEIFKDIFGDKNEFNHSHDRSHKQIEKFDGFKTANNKEIKVSAPALLKTKDIFKDIDTATGCEMSVENEIDQSEVNLKKSDTEKAIEELDEDLNFVFENDIQEVEIKPMTFCGFQTASNKPVHISEKALKDSKKLFTDIKLDDDLDNVWPIKANQAVLKKSHTDSNITANDTKVNLKENKTFPNVINLNSNKTNTFLSFKTASNRPINVSKQAMEKSKRIFEELDVMNTIDDEDKEIVPFRGFPTNREPNISKDTSNKEVLKDIDKQDDFRESNNDFVRFQGFQTANNKPISISTKALIQSKALFKDIDEEVNIPNDSNDEVKKETFNDLGHSETAFGGYGKFTCPDIPKINKPIFQGFKTASNKQVSLSAEALEKSKNLFKDLHCEDDSNKNVISQVNDAPFQGFQTASNKQISVSSKALAQSKLIFKDIDDYEGKNKTTEVPNSDKVEVFKGFRTGNKKPVAISAEALAKSKDFFKDIDENNSDLTNSRDCGFKTGNQKPITISSAALAKTKAVFKNIDNDDSSLENDKFGGFLTANNKSVKVSSDALLKSKEIFKESEGNQKQTNQFKGFQTASNKKVKISEEALTKTRAIFQDISLHDEHYKENIAEKSNCQKESHINPKDTFREPLKIFKNIQENNTTPKSKLEIKKQDKINVHDNLEKLIDTQIINDFEETLCTEDFGKDTTPRQSKRSGSPILSCPRAKKRKKFETPYTSQKHASVTVPKKVIPVEKQDTTMIFNNDYKKNKRFTLKDLAEVEKRNKQMPTDPYLLNFNINTFLDFEFLGQRNDISEGKLSIEDLKSNFEKSVNKKLIPIGWIENHLKLIIWKLISYEIKFPYTLTNVCTAKNVLDQLKYRFDRELYNAERPALRKIFEKDDVASKTIVLCVGEIYVDGISVKSVTNITSNVELLLTDGWYCIKACIDKMLTKFVYDEKITVGCKIVTYGAELVNCEQGVAPWEDTSSVRLKIFGNSTRRARWDARLGYHGNAAILTPLSSVKPEGGKVSKLRLFVTRAYPMLYVEKFEDGSTVTRSERLEHIHQVKYESERQIAMEKLYEEVEKELSDQESQESFGSQILGKLRKNTADKITESQAKSLEDRSNRKRERLILNVQERVRKKIEDKRMNVGRNVVTLLKARVAGVDVKDGNVTVTKGFMSIWKPNDLLTEIIKEGGWIDVMNVVPTAVRYSEIHLSAGRQSIFSQSKRKEETIDKHYTTSLKRICYHIKDLAQNPTMATDYNEIDTVGLIILIDKESNQPFQNIYLADSEKNIICINFWGGLKKFGFQNILEVGQIVYGTNLQKRAGNTRKSVPQFRVTEFTNFTKTPKDSVARSFIEILEKKLSGLNRKKYCEECTVLKNNYSSKNATENVSPYRFNNDHNLTKNRVFIDSPLAAKSDDNFNLTGLDFESTFRQTDTQELSPRMLQRKKVVRQKIAKLKMVGEPPPLSPLHIINKSRSALNSYKSPLAQNSVASTKQNYQNSNIDQGITSSPVIQCNVNKTNVSIEKLPCKNEGISKQFHSSPLIQINASSSQKSHQNVMDDIQSSPLVQTNVTSLKKSCQNSRISRVDIQSSPVFSMNRTYVKNVNPVKLNFSDAQDNSLDDVVDHFAEEFDGSPPLSLD